MATTPTVPPTDIKLTVSDGITGAIQEVCKTIQALCQLGMSTEGQETLKYWRNSDVEFRAAVAEGWTAVTKWFGGIGQ